MGRGRRWGSSGWALLAGVVCLAGVLWTVWALPAVNLKESDTAGVLSFGAGVISAVLGGGGLLISARSLRLQQAEPETAARELARLVHIAEGREFSHLLGGDRRSYQAANLRFTLHTADDVQHADERGTLAQVVEYYRALRPGRLAITGSVQPDAASLGTGGADRDRDAGTGKTVLALALILALTREKSDSPTTSPDPGRGPREAVPVRLSAAGWDGSEISVWLKTHLRQVHGRAKHVAEALVDGHLVLPVIDGIDEMDQDPSPGRDSRAAQLMAALDRYRHGHEPAPLVLTCRRPQYEALLAARAQAQAVARVEIARVDAVWARGFIHRRVGPQDVAQWARVLDRLRAQPHGELARALDTPWRLLLATAVFAERDRFTGQLLRNPEDLIGLAEHGTLYPFLLDHYIHAATQARARSEADFALNTGRAPRAQPLYTPERTWRQLAVLADYLHTNTIDPPRSVAGRMLSSTDLIMHELWPLAGRARLVSTIVTALLLVAIAAVIQDPILASSGNALLEGVGIVLLMAAGLTAHDHWNAPWPEPARMDLTRLRTHAGLRNVAAAVLGGLLFGLAFGLLVVVRFHRSPMIGIPVGLVAGLMAGFTAGLMADVDRRTARPHDPLRGVLVVGLVIGIVAGVVGELALEIAFGLTPGFTARLTAMTSLGLGAGLMIGFPAIVRYLALLLCSRGRLPGRLGRFLAWCYATGLVRISGIAYQFRHRELQDHLATRPNPPTHL